VQNNQVGKLLDAALLEWVQTVNVTGNAKGKGFQGMVKKFHIKGGWASHGHKFTRTWGSKGNRKPRRTMKWHPHAWHMWTQRVTVQDVKVIDVLNRDKEQLLVLKWSLPGARNGVLKVVLA
jgi:large subunit ribosomal protein L3